MSWLIIKHVMTDSMLYLFKVIFCTINNTLCYSSVSVSLWKLCCGPHVVRHQTRASSDASDMFVRPSVDDFKTSRAEMNCLGSLNLILQPGDEDQKRGLREKEGKQESLNKGEREGGACYFTAVWKIWLAWGCPTLQETASPGERERQTRAMAWRGGWMEFRVYVFGGVLWGYISYFCFYRADKITAWNVPYSRTH